MPLTLTKDTAGGLVQFQILFVVLPGKRRLIILGQKISREQTSLDILNEFREGMIERSGDWTTSRREHEYKPVKVRKKGVGTGEERKDTSTQSVGDERVVIQAVQLTVRENQPQYEHDAGMSGNQRERPENRRTKGEILLRERRKKCCSRGTRTNNKRTMSLWARIERM